MFFNDQDSLKLFENLTGAKECAEKILGPGIECGKVHEAAEEYLKGCGLSGYFVHSLGHGVGIDVHELPYLKAGETQVLKEGMVVTVEPGFYMPGIGGMRIEDTYRITGEGSEKLTRQYQ